MEDTVTILTRVFIHLPTDYYLKQIQSISMPGTKKLNYLIFLSLYELDTGFLEA